MRDISKRIARLPLEQQKELARRLQDDGGQFNVFPLSFAQQRLWFIDQLRPGDFVYNISTAFRLAGSLDIEILERSLNEIVRRHEALRTTFASVAGQPVQVIAPTLRLHMPIVDLARVPTVERGSALRQFAQDQARRPFDLVRGPLVRAGLVRLSDREHLLSLTVHHIVCDGWSLGIVFKELSALYDSYCHGESSPLPDLAVQYADYSVWQRGWLRDGVLEDLLSYWKQQLQGAPPDLNLPANHRRSPIRSSRGARREFVLLHSLSEQIEILSQRVGATVFMVLLAAWGALLHRYSGQNDLVVGTPVAGRHRIETEALVGFFVNLLALRIDLSGDPTFLELLARVRRTALEAYDHQELPFETLVEELRPDRDLSSNPLFQTMFVFQNAASDELQLHGLATRPYPVEKGAAALDLTLIVASTPQGLKGKLEYSTDLFEPATVDRMADHLRTFLAGAMRHPNRRLSELPLLDGDERRQLLADWGATKADDSPDRCAYELVEAWAAGNPQALAVIAEGVQITYGDLNARANRLARHLRGLQVGPETPVAICLERTPAMVVAVLAVLKAGGAYVGLDPDWPMDRLRFALDDTGARVLVTEQRLRSFLPAGDAAVVCLEREAATIATYDSADLPVLVQSNNLAYVIYTSGSTGRPKGVAVTHAGISTMARVHAERLELRRGRRMLLFHSLSFDPAGAEIFSALTSGAALVTAPADQLQPGLGLRRLLREQLVDTALLPPALLAAMSPDDAGGLRAIAVGGAVCPGPVVDRWSPGRQLHNAYGPTEATVIATWGPLDGAAPTVIGGPAGHSEIYVLDRRGDLVPVGVPGELHIGGPGLARGYLRQPGLTAERFVPHPFGSKPGQRLYRTGDLVRWRAEGALEFLGRIDDQVKIRGFRVELGEVEAVLTRHPSVVQAAAKVVGEAAEEQRLVAYVVPLPGMSPAAVELRRFLLARVPAYLVPNYIVVLENLPRLPNGKVDRRRLPAPDPERPELEQGFVAPRNQTERLLADIWAEVLGVSPVGIHDDFFELGGHSLLAAQVVSRARDAFQVELPLRAIFEVRTVAGLAEQIDTLRWAASGGQPAGDAGESAREEGAL